MAMLIGLTGLTDRRDGVADATRRRRSLLALAGWALVVGVAFLIGLVAHPGYPDGDWLPPLHATRRAVTAGVAGAVVFAAVVVWGFPRLASRLGWRPLLLTSWLVATTWAVLLASSSGWAAVASPMDREEEYIAALPGVGSDPLGWLDRFPDLVATLPTHPAGHPPLPVLVVWALDRVGLGGPVPLAAVCIAAGASSVVAVLVTVRALGHDRVAGEQLARRAAPFVALAPFALTVATSMDAFFTGVAAWGVAALAVGSTRLAAHQGSTGAASLALGAVAGALLVSVLYLNYGLVVVGALAIAVAVLRPAPRVWAAAVAAGLLVVAAFTAAGFWWFDGVAATSERWAAGTGSQRPYAYALLGNLAVFGVLTGPATAVALGWVRERALVLLGGAALVAVLALDLSGVTRGEVERIWLPLAPWAMVVTAALPPRWVRPALAAQVLTAALVQTMLRLSW